MDLQTILSPFNLTNPLPNVAKLGLQRDLGSKITLIKATQLKNKKAANLIYLLPIYKAEKIATIK